MYGHPPTDPDPFPTTPKEHLMIICDFFAVRFTESVPLHPLKPQIERGKTFADFETALAKEHAGELLQLLQAMVMILALRPSLP
jgi:hypothetical protein